MKYYKRPATKDDPLLIIAISENGSELIVKYLNTVQTSHSKRKVNISNDYTEISLEDYANTKAEIMLTVHDIEMEVADNVTRALYPEAEMPDTTSDLYISHTSHDSRDRA